MYKPFPLKPPFFEFGPKAYLYGDEILKLAGVIDKAAIEYDVDVVLTPQPTDISRLAAAMRRVMVFAQHMEPLPVGRGLGSILPEAIREAGAVGVMLNHAEKPLERDVLQETIVRADAVGLATMVCADTLDDIRAMATMGPNVIVAEPTALIGSGQTSDDSYVLRTIDEVHSINPDIMVLQGAGISSGRDVYNVIKLGAQATGSTSGIIKAPDPAAMAREMISSLRRAWDEAHPKN